MIRIRPLLLALCGAVACSASASSRTEEVFVRSVPVVDTVPGGPAAVDLSGSWVTGNGAEPDVPRIVIRGQCNYSPAAWILEQRGDTVFAWTIPEIYAQGVPTRVTWSRAPTIGRISGVNVTIGTGTMRYLLRYDSTSGHLRGTLNGAPVWAIRKQVIRQEGCIPVP